uniref:hypothetical protein n=1 Tax=Prevotella sp. TaxID=59823 RepID=UPI004024C097
MIKIYDINDKLLMQAEVTSAAKREQEMSKSDYITLSFSAAEKVILPVGAYINYTYKIDKVREVTRKFLLLESYEPIQTDECSWKYTPQFQHPKMILSKTPFFIYTRNSQNVEVKQNVWSFVGTTSALSGKIADFLNKDLMFGECGWKVIFSNVTANTVNVSFSDNDFISALTAITNAIGDNCEWHIDYDDEIIYIGKVLVGATPVVLEVGKNVGVPNINNSKESYYNAFSIFGGTRNITQVNSKGENVSSGDIRLQLDEGNGTISIDGKERSYSIDKYSTLDLRVNKINEPLFTKVLDFSQIFPSLNTYVYNVRGRVKYVLDENNEKIPISYNADGSIKEYKTFTVWYMRLAYPTTEKVEGKAIINTTVDDGVTHYWYDFQITDDLRINGKNIGCSFEANFNTGALSTPLAGRGSNGEYVGFELTYHKEASSSHTSDDVSASNFSILAGDYEIIYQEDNEVIIPTNAADMLIPRGESMPSLKCNITVLYNIAMSDSIYYEDAQNRLLEKAKEDIVRLLSDLNNYEIKSYSDVFLEENPELQIGQSVTYKDGHGYELATRVLKLSTNIDFGFIQTITLGNQVIKGTITQLKEDVQTIIASGGSSGNGGGYSVSQLRNLIAKYGSDNFLSKQFDDTAHGTITWEKIQKFLQGLTAEDLSQFKKGATFGEFIQGMLFGTGGRIDELGNAEFESITSRSSIIAKELIVNRQTAMESNFVFTESGMVESVVEIPAATEGGNVTYDLKLQKRWDNDFTAFKENDVILASINTLTENGKYYDMWLRVLSVNTVTNTITVVCYPDNECPSKKNYPPCELARLIRWGNAVDEDRQSCWYISSSEGLLVWLDHVTKPIIDKTNYSLAMGKLPDALSFLFQDFPTANKRDGAFYAKWMMAASFQQIDYQGNPIYTTRDRGVWSLAVAQGDNPYRNGDRTIDTVYYLGCKWQCLEDKTTKPPTYSSTAWAFVEGNPYFTLEMLSSKLWNFRLNDLMATNADGSWKVFTTLSVVGRLYNQDVTDSMTNVVWIRDSGDPTADNKWALSHANCGLSVDLTYEDLGGAAFKIGSVTFRCNAEIKDGETMYSEDVSVSF